MRGSRSIRVLLFAVLATWQCSGDTSAQPPTEQVKACLRAISGVEGDGASLSHFDVMWDSPVVGGSFACNLGVAASDVEDAVASFRHAILYPSETSFREGVGLPFFLYQRGRGGDSKSRKVVYSWQEFRETVIDTLTENQRALIACSNARILRIVPDDGAMLSLGFVWYQQRENGFKASVMNLRAIEDEDVLRACRLVVDP